MSGWNSGGGNWKSSWYGGWTGQSWDESGWGESASGGGQRSRGGGGGKDRDEDHGRGEAGQGRGRGGKGGGGNATATEGSRNKGDKGHARGGKGAVRDTVANEDERTRSDKGRDRGGQGNEKRGGSGGALQNGDGSHKVAKAIDAGEALKPGEVMRLNPSDCEPGLALLGATGTGTRERARRKDGAAQWAGVRADCGVASAGRWAFCVWNESGGNLRVGWSTGDAKLALGTDRFSWGYGGTATKSHNRNFEKFGQTYGKDDAVTCLLDLDRRAILYTKNGREIPGDAFQMGKEFSGVALFPHVYTKEATFSVSFDGSGGAPPLPGGYQWIASAPSVPHPTRVSGDGPSSEAQDAGADAGPQFVLTPYGWRTVEQAGGLRQDFRQLLDAYVRHFTSSLEKEYEAEKEAVMEKVSKRSTRQLQDEGIGVAGLAADFDAVSGRIILWPEGWSLPYLSGIKWGRNVLVSTVKGGVDFNDATKTISAEVESIQGTQIILNTEYERLPSSGGAARYRIDLGPNLVANKRIDKMLDELQRCLGTNQAAEPLDSIQKLNYNANLCGLLLPGAPLADAIYADIGESSAAARKWDPLERAPPNEKADISRHARQAGHRCARVQSQEFHAQREDPEPVTERCCATGAGSQTAFRLHPGTSRHGEDDDGSCNHLWLVVDESGARLGIGFQQSGLRQHCLAIACIGRARFENGFVPR